MSNELDRYNIYQGVLKGELTPESAKQKLKVINFSGKEIEIVVTPDEVISVLNKYLWGKLDDKSISNWASFLFFEDAYISPNWEDEEQSDKYEPMWYVIQQLSTPAIDGKITPRKIKEHIKELEFLKQKL